MSLFVNYHFPFQLFRRVAAALPGMEQTEKKPEDSILSAMGILTFSFSLYTLLSNLLQHIASLALEFDLFTVVPSCTDRSLF